MANLNNIEKTVIASVFADIEGKTMEDYFAELIKLVDNMTIDELKTEFKNHYSDETNWSF